MVSLKTVISGLILALASFALVFGVVVPARAVAPIVVNTLTDEDADNAFCSLREAIIAANTNVNYNGCTASGFDDDTITFDISGGGTIQLAGTVAPGMRVLSNMTITNAGGPAIIIRGPDGDPAYTNLNPGMIYLSNDSTRFEIDNLTFTNARSLYGPILSTLGANHVTIVDSTFTDSSGFGDGAIDNQGTMTIVNSTFYNNRSGTASPGGGAIVNHSGATLTVINSTFAGNFGSDSQGAADIMNYGNSTVHLSNTILGNRAEDSGPNCRSEANESDTSAVIADAPNLIEDGSCLTDGAVHLLTGDPKLGSLADNGGNTQSMALQTGSPAVDAGDDSAISGYSTDQNGHARVQGAFVDLGSSESTFRDAVKPTAEMFAFDDIFNADPGGATYSFSIKYTDNVAVDVSTFDNNDVRVTGPNSFNTLATFDSVNTSGNGAERVATYHINTPGGSWDDSENGDYTFSIEADQVKDTPGNAVDAGSIGTFNVLIDSHGPSATLDSHPDVTSSGGTSYTFTVKYEDDSLVKVSTLDSDDIRVTGPNSFDTAATFVSADPSSDAKSVTATYSFTPPGGSWSADDVGQYSIALEDDQVDDFYDTSADGDTLGTFDVTLKPEIDVTDGSNSVPDGGSFTFPATILNTPTQQTFTIANSGNGTLNVSDLTLPTGFSLVGVFPSTVAADGGSATFTVQCDAVSEGSFTGMLSFTNDDEDENPYNFDLTCAVGVPEITVLRKTVELANGQHFEFQPGDSLTLIIRNDGSHDLTLTAPIELEGSKSFKLTQDIGATTLAPTETTTFTLTCDKDTDEAKTGEAHIVSNDADENPFVLDLRCAPHHEKAPEQPTPAVPVENFLCTNTTSLTGGAIRIGAGKSTLNGSTGDIYCSLLAQDGALMNNGAGIGDANVLILGVTQAVNLYGLLPGGYPANTFVEPVQVCLRGTGGILFIHYNVTAQQREETWLPAVQDGDYLCASVPSAGIAVLVSSGYPQPAAPAASDAPAAATATPPPSNALNNCSVTTLYLARMRAEPNTTSDVLANVPYNATLQATEAADGWFRVVFENQQGWIRADLLSTAGDCG